MNFKEDYLLFQEEIAKRKIKYLIHFTPTINLYSILENKKIMSRAKLENLDIAQLDILDYIKFSDNIRYDDKNYINLSISSPNTFLFSKFQSNSKDNPEINWCVLKLAINIFMKKVHYFQLLTLLLIMQKINLEYLKILMALKICL